MCKANSFEEHSVVKSWLFACFTITALAAGAGAGCKSIDDRSDSNASSADQNSASFGMSSKEKVALYRQEINALFADKEQKKNWDWFMDRPHGFVGDSTALIQLLPYLDSDIWGNPEAKFAKFGHFVLANDRNRVLPSSLGIGTFLVEGVPESELLVTTATCGTCHMGRVRVPGSGGDDIVTLYGGVNQQFDLRMWRTAQEATVLKYLSTPEKVGMTADFIRNKIRTMPPGFFVRNIEVNSDDEERRLFQETGGDKKQRKILLKSGRVEKILAQYIENVAELTRGKNRQRRISYPNIASKGSPDIDHGNPGQLDASGDLIAQRVKEENIGRMPNFASMTDFPSVWMQSERSIGQWDGSLSNSYLRNLAAEIAVVPGPTVDRRVGFFADKFIKNLPAPKYLFSTVNPKKEAALAKIGSVIFQRHCAECHKNNDTNFYVELETDPNRGMVMKNGGSKTTGRIFVEACSAKLPDGTFPNPCPQGHFVRDTGVPGSHGYAAPTLTGIWARGPFLHNGSVPTLRHLLAPETRPEKFVLGSLSFDTENVGYSWDIRDFSKLQRADPQVAIFDARMDSLSNSGHDQLSLEYKKETYRLNWSKDPDKLAALIAYLKTL